MSRQLLMVFLSFNLKLEHWRIDRNGATRGRIYFPLFQCSIAPEFLQSKNSGQATCGAQKKLLTAASFRIWRGSQRSAAQGLARTKTIYDSRFTKIPCKRRKWSMVNRGKFP
jgi:hypothetical protein